ncbi:programmed cell death protein 5-like [Clavelina lepadiformis]|uniref:programmed cell death protein 5-like n=1 Tax=Clavelina lepadiformis TaxID=159417 RepID=UPI004042A3F4
MEEDGLAALRAKRMQELQGQFGAGDPDEQKKRKQQQEQQQEMLHSMLSQILDQNARARLNSIALVKPEKAKQVEAMLITMAQRGQIADKMTESQLVGLLEQVSGKSQKTTVKFERRRVMDSDSD